MALVYGGIILEVLSGFGLFVDHRNGIMGGYGNDGSV